MPGFLFVRTDDWRGPVSNANLDVLNGDHVLGTRRPLSGGRILAVGSTNYTQESNWD